MLTLPEGKTVSLVTNFDVLSAEQDVLNFAVSLAKQFDEFSAKMEEQAKEIHEPE